MGNEWVRKLLACDIGNDKELYSEEESVSYEQEIEDDINEQY